MIRKADRSVVILDFGIAKDLGSTIGLTRTPGYIGTPGYSAPEQEFGDVDHRADVFSLGALLYELVTGKFAFEGRRLKDLRAAVLNLEPPPAHEVRPEVGAPLSGLIAAMMEKSPRRRPSDMGAVIAALDRIAAGGP
jgi:serine/threonine protein kinase